MQCNKNRKCFKQGIMHILFRLIVDSINLPILLFNRLNKSNEYELKVITREQCDQPKQGIVNTPAKMDEYVKEHGFAGWFETSAKENINIEEAARALVNKVR